MRISCRVGRSTAPTRIKRILKKNKITLGRATAPKAHRVLYAFTVAWGRSPAPTLLSLPINNLPPFLPCAQSLLSHFLPFVFLAVFIVGAHMMSKSLSCFWYRYCLFFLFYFIISDCFYFLLFFVFVIYLMDFGHDLFVLDGLVYIYFIYITIKLIFAAFVLFFFLVFIPFSVFNLSHYH